MAVFLFMNSGQLKGEMVFLWSISSEDKKKPLELSKSIETSAMTSSKSLIDNDRNNDSTKNSTESSLKVNVCKDGVTLVRQLLDKQYEMWQLHVHWGSADGHGSEHKIDGNYYAGELHLVLWNKKYKSPDEAEGKKDGLIVIAFLIEIGEKHQEFEKIFQALNKHSNKNDDTLFGPEVEIDCAKFLPNNVNFLCWTYYGSLNASPLVESVIWVVFQKPLRISSEQMNALRALNVANLKRDIPSLNVEKSIVKPYVENDQWVFYTTKDRLPKSPKKPRNKYSPVILETGANGEKKIIW